VSQLDATLFAELERAGEVARTAEAQGFDGLISFEGSHDPFVPLVLAARETERLELSTGIAIAFARNPMICAYLANDLQLVSRGRFVLGLGTQIRPHIEKRFSQPWSKPNPRMREFVQAIRAIWRAWATGERLAHRGAFYTHTLMTPFFSPGPNPYGTPKIALAGFGPGMVRVAGEVADRWIVHPLHSPSYVQAHALPALAEGAARAGRAPGAVEISCQTITMIGSNDAEIAAARQKAKAQIAFYGSTPAYRVVLDHHGWGDLQPELNRMSKEGRWTEMIGLVTDDMLDTIGVSGRPAEAGRKLRVRNASWAQRTTPVLYNETAPDAVIDLLRAYRDG
jgi:probable F420-dependent oxidoreductase